jgi:succinate dehydrogenase / fumarate reductase iron-sulfur subunit
MNAQKTLRLTLKIWRQKNRNTKGKFETYEVSDISTGASFLEMLDILNEQLINQDKEPIAFDHDCREGICGTCSLYINGRAHGPDNGITTCQLHMRMFTDGQTIVIEPWRSVAFPVIKDLITDRGAFDRIMAAGGFISVNTSGSTLDANAIAVPKEDADKSMDAASCISCGACVACCPNGAAMLFVGAKVSHFALLPQGRVEAKRRVLNMVKAMDEEGFGNCSVIGACEVEYPKNISLDNIARLNKEYMRAWLDKK